MVYIKKTFLDSIETYNIFYKLERTTYSNIKVCKVDIENGKNSAFKFKSLFTLRKFTAKVHYQNITYFYLKIS